MRKLVLGVMACIFLTGCADGDEQEPTASAAADHALTEAVNAVCQAREAIDDSIEPSWRIFQNQAHAALHELAREVTEQSRGTAAALLEAKQRVEVAFVEDMDPKGFRRLMSQLLEASNTALEQLSLTLVSCP